LTDAFLSKIEDRSFLKEKLTEKYNYVKTGCSWKSGKDEHASYYFYKNDGLQNQYVLMRQKTLDSTPELFFDPNTLAADGTKSLGATAFSDSGRYWAYGVSASGSDWQTIHVKDTSTGDTLEDKVAWVKFSGISWLKDDSGFFYNRYPEPASLSAAGAGSAGDDEAKMGSETDANVNMAVYLHILGEPQSSDRLIYRTPDNPKWLFGAQVTDDGAYFILTVHESTAPVNRIFLAEVPALLRQLQDKPGEIIQVDKVIDNFDAGGLSAQPVYH
jgi:prolyl oligopeptidase